MRNFPRVFSVDSAEHSPCGQLNPADMHDASTAQTFLAKFSSLEILTLKNYLLLCWTVCLLGVAIPGSLSSQFSQDLGGAGFLP